MRIINISGPINSGKTTISKLLEATLPAAFFIEVDDLLSDEEQQALDLTLAEGWAERLFRLNTLLRQHKRQQNYQNIIFAYPITVKTYTQLKALEDTETRFISITLAPTLEICIQNRGKRQLNNSEIKRIREMYAQGYHKPPFSDLIIDNSCQTPQETLFIITDFLTNT